MIAAFFSQRIASTTLAIGLGLTAIAASEQFGYHHVTLKFLVICLSLCALSFLVIQKGLSFQIAKSRNLRWSVVVIFLATLIATFLSHVGERVTGLSQLILWLLLVFALSALAHAEGEESFLQNFISVHLLFVVFCFLGFAYSEFYLREAAKPFFGNANVASNFIALSILQLLFFSTFVRAKSLRILAWTFALLGFLILWSFVARGALLGLLMGVTYFAWSFLRTKRLAVAYYQTFKPVLFVVFALLLVALIYFVSLKGLNTLKYRASFWANTGCLIKDHPLGVGPGSFEYVFQHYNGKCTPSQEIGEGQHVRNPHNSLIEFFAEIGILGGVALLLALFFLARELQRVRGKNEFAKSWLISCALVIFGISLFEFPQDTPYTFFFLAILAGFSLALIPATRNRASALLRSANFAVSFLILVIFAIKAYSDHLTLKPGKNPESSYSTACSIDKENWRACTFLALVYIDSNRFSEADKLIAELHRKFGDHHSQMHLRGAYALKQNDLTGACTEFRRYHELFGGRSSKKAFLDQNCR